MGPLRSGSYQVTAPQRRQRLGGHLQIGSTDHFEGISASHIRGQTRPEMAPRYIIAVFPGV